jgi:hypothetical protein
MTAARNMTMDALLALPVRVGIQTAAAALGIGRNEAYRLAEADEFPCPVHRRGGALVVFRPDLFRAVGLDPSMVRAPEQLGEAS